ncbi:protein COFACTOR ASSEMBLY OF COMPLEX C SUBUNIT B CCB2, chloroplastic isoform X2 [Mangifera indica]|uniref:protein COFACTOR ASSEMBLY OF COMPLEX C SUBUNIT B CCB2, chloroplastic isoform X2 n=1 Tax=Mangifera indica TaxID=29780 RepID=UPI001CFB48EB|nr:protein COFACTOR ASSEMBLY OF COMPLEX C SUBUNIT B CCB2, chloroplastic isoform X2 [Mangifera indica]
MSIHLSSPLIQFKIPIKSRAKTRIKSSSISARLDSSQQPDQQLNLSVLRFTFGIPGFDESYLPRWIGYGFGSLLVLNHFVFSNSVTSAQLRSEGLGLSLAAFSVALPYLGKFLKGATPMDQKILPESTDQIFVMSQNISDTLKEDLAWATYVLLRNTNSISVLISFRGELCIRGYWSTPDGLAKSQLVEWFERQIEKIGLSDLKESLYFPQSADSGIWEMLPKETSSLFVQPVIQTPNPSAGEMEKIEGFVLLASSIRYAYRDKDRAWIRAIANKFRDLTKV